MGKAENTLFEAFGNTQPKGGKEQRGEPRYMVSWRVAVSVDGRTPCYGRLRDISLNGAAVLNEFNLEPGVGLTLCIHVPALDRSSGLKTMVIRGTAVYTVYDTGRRCWRTGVAFNKFEEPSDHDYLKGRLANYYALEPELVLRRSTDQD